MQYLNSKLKFYMIIPKCIGRNQVTESYSWLIFNTLELRKCMGIIKQSTPPPPPKIMCYPPPFTHNNAPYTPTHPLPHKIMSHHPK